MICLHCIKCKPRECVESSGMSGESSKLRLMVAYMVFMTISREPGKSSGFIAEWPSSRDDKRSPVPVYLPGNSGHLMHHSSVVSLALTCLEA